MDHALKLHLDNSQDTRKFVLVFFFPSAGLNSMGMSKYQFA